VSEESVARAFLLRARAVLANPAKNSGLVPLRLPGPVARARRLINEATPFACD